MRRRYFLYRPRGFDNEYTIYVVEENSDMQARLLRMLDYLTDHNDSDAKYARITREAAIRLGIREPRRAERQGFNRIEGGLCQHSQVESPHGKTDNEVIDMCMECTEYAVTEWEQQQFELPPTEQDMARWREEATP